MKQRRISAIILAMILLLSSFCFTGTFAEELPKHELNLPGESAALPEVGGAEICGAVYDIRSGEVRWLD